MTTKTFDTIKPSQAPGPKGRFLAGNLNEFRQDRHAYLISLRETYGDVVRFRLGPRPVYLVAHPDDILHVLGHNSDNYHKGSNYDWLFVYCHGSD